MERTNFPLRLLPSLHKAAQRVAAKEDCSMNQLINLALAEKLAVMDEEYWNERKRQAVSKPKSNVLERLAGNEKPQPGDEIPDLFKRRKSSYSSVKTSKAGD